jgi:hypothetical protein
MSSKPSSADIVTWAKILLKRKKIQRRFSTWARLYGVEPAPHHRLLTAITCGGGKAPLWLNQDWSNIRRAAG